MACERKSPQDRKITHLLKDQAASLGKNEKKQEGLCVCVSGISINQYQDPVLATEVDGLDTQVNTHMLTHTHADCFIPGVGGCDGGSFPLRRGSTSPARLHLVLRVEGHRHTQ